MILSQQNPVVFIACLVGMALVATLVWVCFFLLRRRFYGAKLYDAEQPLHYMDVGPGHPPPPDSGHQQHPPVYCVDDLVYPPPPSYQTTLTRTVAPTAHEMHALRRRLEKLQRRRRSRRGAVDVTPYETALRDAEIGELAAWIQRLEMLGEQEAAAPLLGRRRRARRLVQSEIAMRNAPAGQRYVLQRSATEPGLVCWVGERDVALPLTPASSPIPGDMTVQLAVLREQLMRSTIGRQSTER